MSKNIQIFVSHRLGINSYKIKNSFFVNVLCGAYRSHEASGLLGDDNGETISEKQPYYSELTVQYWAWKNHTADYYGLCHYRRYLSFSERHFPASPANFLHEHNLCKRTAQKFALTDKKRIRELTDEYDCIVAEPSLVSGWAWAGEPCCAKTVRELWINFGNICEKDIDILENIINDNFPEYSSSLRTYFDADSYTGFNCFLMSRELFFRLCDFQFSVLACFEKIVDASAYEDENKKRVYGYVGEILYGVFVRKLEAEKLYKLCRLQLVIFSHTEKLRGVERLTCAFFPHGSKLRSLAKKLTGFFRR